MAQSHEANLARQHKNQKIVFGRDVSLKIRIHAVLQCLQSQGKFRWNNNQLGQLKVNVDELHDWWLVPGDWRTQYLITKITSQQHQRQPRPQPQQQHHWTWKKKKRNKNSRPQMSWQLTRALAVANDRKRHESEKTGKIFYYWENHSSRWKLIFNYEIRQMAQ